ncbi:DNA polymerase-3 subunit epsilon [Streptomyces sp. Amel2xB2]|nr:DEDDh family exonuclease [Streptomyces sp. Amel2xB2]RAJ65706.1 DNA polymerase-3 subunit epsilon [Streptomyces sp. Amel2xB2]
MLEDHTALPGEPGDGDSEPGAFTDGDLADGGERPAAARLPAQSPAAGSGSRRLWPEEYPEGYAVVDVETTGLARDDRIVSAAVYRLDARGEVQDHWYSTVNPQRDPGPTWIHGLTSEDLVDAPLFTEIADELGARLDGRVLVAHNAIFDWSMIAREYARARRTPPVRQRLCTIALAKRLSLPLPNHKLESLAAHYGVSQRRAHHALDDARVLAEAFRPSLHLAAQQEVRLPLHACRPLAEWAEGADAAGAGADGGGAGNRGSGVPGARSGGRYGRGPAASRPYGFAWRRSRKLPPCPYPNPGRYEPGGRLIQGMRVAISGDTSVDRELLEDRATEAGLHVSSQVSRLTSLLVTNDPGSLTSKVVKAQAYGTPVLDEAAFRQLLQCVAPAAER